MNIARLPSECGWDYAKRLRAAGVKVTSRRYDGMLHGFVHFAEPFDDARRAITDLGQAMKEALAS